MILISPELKRIKVKNRRIFAKEYGLSYNSICSLVTGRRIGIKGWLSNHRKNRKRVKSLIKRYTLVNLRTGDQVYVWPGVKQFAEKEGLSYLVLNRLISGVIPKYKDWIRKDTYDLLYTNILDRNFKK